MLTQQKFYEELQQIATVLDSPTLLALAFSPEILSITTAHDYEYIYVRQITFRDRQSFFELLTRAGCIEKFQKSLGYLNAIELINYMNPANTMSVGEKEFDFITDDAYLLPYFKKAICSEREGCYKDRQRYINIPEALRYYRKHPAAQKALQMYLKMLPNYKNTFTIKGNAFFSLYRRPNAT